MTLEGIGIVIDPDYNFFEVAKPYAKEFMLKREARHFRNLIVGRLIRGEDGSINFIRNNIVTLVIRSDFKGDLKLGNKIAEILCGGKVSPGTPVSEQYLLDLEREGFKSLCGEKKTQERIQYTLKTGKTLRN